MSKQDRSFKKVREPHLVSKRFRVKTKPNPKRSAIKNRQLTEEEHVQEYYEILEEEGIELGK